jgi:hypothetical protein
VLFGKDPKASKLEVLNDIDGELIDFYRVLKRKQNNFLKGFEWLLVSRQIFEELKKVDPSCLSAEERAVRFFYLIKASINGKRDCFLSAAGRKPALNLERIILAADPYQFLLYDISVHKYVVDRALNLWFNVTVDSKKFRRSG